MKIKIDPKIAKLVLTLSGMGLTALGSMISTKVQKIEQTEAITKIAQEIVEEALKNQAKGS